MAERLNLQNLTDLIVKVHSIDKKDAEKFIKHFFLLIEESLETDKSVKIKGLGTFKLISIDSRESINVNTGERFKIEGYTKISFTPDAAIRDAVNKPFADFETIVLNKPIETTINDNISSSDSANNETDKKTIVVVDNQNIEQTDTDLCLKENIDNESSVLPLINPDSERLITSNVPLKSNESAVNELSSAEDISRSTVVDSIIARELRGAPPKAQQPIPTITPNKKKEKKTKEKSPLGFLIAIIVIIFLLCTGVVVCMYYPNLFSRVEQLPSKKVVVDKDTKELKDVEKVSDISDNEQVTLQEQADTSDLSEEKVLPDSNAKTDVQSITPSKNTTTVGQSKSNTTHKEAYAPDSTSYIIVGTRGTYKIKEGETLTMVSLSNYGTKNLWPYIVEHNKKIITNPNKVTPGTVVQIPELKKK